MEIFFEKENVSFKKNQNYTSCFIRGHFSQKTCHAIGRRERNCPWHYTKLGWVSYGSISKISRRSFKPARCSIGLIWRHINAQLYSQKWSNGSFSCHSEGIRIPFSPSSFKTSVLVRVRGHSQTMWTCKEAEGFPKSPHYSITIIIE